jgi:hypothetical protein
MPFQHLHDYLGFPWRNTRTEKSLNCILDDGSVVTGFKPRRLVIEPDMQIVPMALSETINDRYDAAQ